MNKMEKWYSQLAFTNMDITSDPFIKNRVNKICESPDLEKESIPKNFSSIKNSNSASVTPTHKYLIKKMISVDGKKYPFKKILSNTVQPTSIKSTNQNLLIINNIPEQQIKQNNLNLLIVDNIQEQQIKPTDQNLLIVDNIPEQQIKQNNLNLLVVDNILEQQIKPTDQNLLIVDNIPEQPIKPSDLNLLIVDNISEQQIKPSDQNLLIVDNIPERKEEPIDNDVLIMGNILETQIDITPGDILHESIMDEKVVSEESIDKNFKNIEKKMININNHNKISTLHNIMTSKSLTKEENKKSTLNNIMTSKSSTKEENKVKNDIKEKNDNKNIQILMEPQAVNTNIDAVIEKTTDIIHKISLDESPQDSDILPDNNLVEKKWPALSIDDLTISFRVVGKLVTGSKIKIQVLDNKYLQNCGPVSYFSFSESLSRYNGCQSRGNTLAFLKHLYDETERNVRELLEDIRNNIEVDNKVASLADLICNMVVFLHKYDDMSYAYIDDPTTKAKFDGNKEKFNIFRLNYFRETAIPKKLN